MSKVFLKRKVTLHALSVLISFAGRLCVIDFLALLLKTMLWPCFVIWLEYNLRLLVLRAIRSVSIIILQECFLYDVLNSSWTKCSTRSIQLETLNFVVGHSICLETFSILIDLRFSIRNYSYKLRYFSSIVCRLRESKKAISVNKVVLWSLIPSMFSR